MVLEKIGTFLKLILKNGGASFVLTLLLAWLFREYFHINPAIVVVLLEYMLWAAFFQSLFSLVRGELFTTLQKWRDYKAGKPVSLNGKSVSAIGKDLGLDTMVKLVEKGSELREKISVTKDEKKKSKLLKELDELDAKLAKMETETD